MYVRMYEFTSNLHYIIKTHSSVSAAKKTKKMCGTQVCYLLVLQSYQIQPSVSPKLLSWFLPNLYILCLTYTLLHILNLKEITSAVLEIFVPKNCPIFFTFFFLLLRTKLQIHLSHIKITFPCFDFSQIWNTYIAHWGLHFSKILRNSKKNWGSYVLWYCKFFHNLSSHLLDALSMLWIWKFFPTL